MRNSQHSTLLNLAAVGTAFVQPPTEAALPEIIVSHP
jgi:hypothetical protein